MQQTFAAASADGEIIPTLTKGFGKLDQKIMDLLASAQSKISEKPGQSWSEFSWSQLVRVGQSWFERRGNSFAWDTCNILAKTLSQVCLKWRILQDT